jgi:hypothetical protein
LGLHLFEPLLESHFFERLGGLLLVQKVMAPLEGLQALAPLFALMVVDGPPPFALSDQHDLQTMEKSLPLLSADGLLRPGGLGFHVGPLSPQVCGVAAPGSPNG